MGFEDAEAALYIDPAAGYLVPPEEGVQLAQDGIDPFGQSLTFKPVHPVVATSIPDSVVNYVKLFTRPDGQQVVKIAGHLTVEVQNALVQAFALEGATVERNIRNLYRVQMAYQPRASAASGFSVPTLEVFDRQLGLAYPLEAEVFAEFGNWSLSGAPALLDEAAFPTAQEKQTSSFDVRLGNTGKTEVRYDQVAANATDEWKLPFFEHGSDFELNNLIFWLDRQLARTDLGQLDLHAWLRRVIDALREKRGLALADVLVLKYRLLTALKRQLTRLHQASSAAGQALLFDAPPDHVEIRWNHAFAFDPFQPPYHKPEPLAGSGFQFAKHLYLVIQDMKRSGEEFECAVALDQSPAVAKWVRNVPLHPKSFWLPLADGRFFPDFVAQLTDGRVMVVEYKGDMLATNDDSKEKQRVGQLWEKVSGGQGVFLWAVKAGPQGELVAQQIAGKVDE
jgi:type III restriction enzyme